MLAWCNMPNHVHAALELLQDHAAGSIFNSWKSFTANKANSLAGRSGAFWHDDYLDRDMQIEDHLATAVTYVERTPFRQVSRLYRQKWAWGSAHRRQPDHAGPFGRARWTARILACSGMSIVENRPGKTDA